MNKTLVTCCLLAVCSTGAYADFSGKVISVADGGRVLVATDKQNVVVNLNGLVTPFPNQNLYNQAHIVFENVFLGREVNVITKNQIDDRCVYGEVISNGINLNEALLMTGYAWIYNDIIAPQKYKDIEENNQKENVGLWNPDYHFLFNAIPLNGSDLLDQCITNSIGNPSIEKQTAFYEENQNYGFSLFIKTLVYGGLLGVFFWYSLFWFDKQGFNFGKIFKRKKKNKE